MRDAPTPPRPAVRGFLAGRLRVAALCLLPTLAVAAVLEAGARFLVSARPSLTALPTLLEAVGMLRPDPDLLFSLAPGASDFDGQVLIRTNSLGLRTPEVGPKAPGEYRILCLGESTTMGIGVDEGETYSARLERLLRQRRPGRPWTVVNAGVASYSSYQSLLYLRERGLALRPDLVLFYHEVNDYLPSTARHTSSLDFGVGKTDKEYHDLGGVRLHRVLMRHSSLYRLAFARMAAWRIERAGAAVAKNPLPQIGLPEIGLPNLLLKQEGEEEREAVGSEYSLGRRVSEEERRWVLESLVGLCRSEGIGIVLIHPSYADSVPHECLLTRFARAGGVPLFEAYPALHRAPGDAGLFIDSWHPSAAGHERLAAALEEFLGGLPGFPRGPAGAGASALSL